MLYIIKIDINNFYIKKLMVLVVGEIVIYSFYSI